jgi:TetR/AcrR family transcriptional regulator
MGGLASSLVHGRRYVIRTTSRPRSQAKRSRIVEIATLHFAENGFHAARMGDIARALGIAKGSIFQHFGSKEGLFFEVYKRAVRSFPKYLDAPPEVRANGFFDILQYWLLRTEHLQREDGISYHISWLGNYGANLPLKREIDLFLIAEDPRGTGAFVRFGLERGELRKDIEMEMIVSIVDWTMDRLQQALLQSNFHVSLFRAQVETPEKREARIRQFVSVLRRAVGVERRSSVRAPRVDSKLPPASPTAKRGKKETRRSKSA